MVLSSWDACAISYDVIQYLVMYIQTSCDVYFITLWRKCNHCILGDMTQSLLSLLSKITMTSYYRECNYCTCITWYGTYWIKYYVHITRYCTNITRYRIYITKFSNKATFYTPTIFIYMETSPLPVKRCMYTRYSWTFFNLSHPSLHSRYPWLSYMSMELSLPVLMTQVCRGRDSNPDLPHARRMLY